MRNKGLLKKELLFENEDGILIRVIRKPIKNIYIRIYPPEGNVIVSAPPAAPMAKIKKFTESKRNWIRKHHQKLKLTTGVAEKEFVSGEIHYFGGNEFRLIVEYSDQDQGVRVEKDNIVLRAGKEYTVEQRKRMLEMWYRKKLMQKILVLANEWEQKMNLRINEYRIRKMKTRWGSCNTAKRRIWLNLELAKYPDEILEYIIVHEMTHLLEQKHNRRFYSIMEKYLPDWKERRRMLKACKY